MTRAQLKKIANYLQLKVAGQSNRKVPAKVLNFSEYKRK